jgi:hypothetical protein
MCRFPIEEKFYKTGRSALRYYMSQITGPMRAPLRCRDQDEVLTGPDRVAARVREPSGNR